MSFADETSLYISDANTEKLFDNANIEIKKNYIIGSVQIVK